MVEPSHPVVDPDVAEGVLRLFAQAASPSVIHAGLNQVAELALMTTGACGAAVVQRCGSGARVAVGVGALDWVQGRLVPRGDAFLPVVDSGGALVSELRVDDLDEDLRRGLSQQGVESLIRAGSVLGGSLIGCLVLGFAGQSPDRASPRRMAIGLLSACLTQLYSREQAGGPGENGERVPDRQLPEDDHNLFIAVTSHELRTPVTVIRGYSDTLDERWEQLDDTARRNAVGVIRQRARDLGRLLDRMLEAAGDSDGNGMPPPEGIPFDLLEAVRQAVRDLPVDLRHDVSLSTPDRLPPVLGDRGTIVTIVTELVTNACKYSEEGPEVLVTAGADAAAGWLRVSDRGIGIQPEDVERAFERFWQSERQGRKRRGGVGLGLYLVRRIVQRQGGWVFLRPRPGGGTIAEVRLPRADTAARKA